ACAINRVANVFRRRLGYYATTSRSKTCPRKCEVHAIGVNVVLFNDNIAEIDDDPKFDTSVGWCLCSSFAQTSLHLCRSGHRAHYAREFCENPIASKFDNAALMFSDLEVDAFAT